MNGKEFEGWEWIGNFLEGLCRNGKIYGVLGSIGNSWKIVIYQQNNRPYVVCVALSREVLLSLSCGYTLKKSTLSLW